jgi:hypothetical protein
MNDASYTKLRSGAWGLRGPSAVITEGADVAVRLKSGKITRQRVGRVLWAGDGVAIATIARVVARGGSASEYCGYPCPITKIRCCSANGPCHDCQ